MQTANKTDELMQLMEGYISITASANKTSFLPSTDILEIVKTTVAAFPHSDSQFEKRIKATDILEIIKTTVAANNHGESQFEKWIKGIVALTDIINTKTSSNMVIFDNEKDDELFIQLNIILSEQVILMDDRFDKPRWQLASTLCKLLESLIEQKKLAPPGQVFETKDYENTNNAIAPSFTTRYEQAASVFRSLVSNVKSRCPTQVVQFLEQSYDTAEKKTQSILTTAQATSNGLIDRGLDIYHQYAEPRLARLADNILKNAQPYLHNAINVGEPYLYVRVLPVLKPYLKPFEPLVARAQSLKAALQEHKLTGPYVNKVCAAANKAYEHLYHLWVYCWTINPAWMGENLPTPNIVGPPPWEWRTIEGYDEFIEADLERMRLEQCCAGEESKKYEPDVREKEWTEMDLDKMMDTFRVLGGEDWMQNQFY